MHRRLEASAGRAQTFAKAAHRPLVCQLRFQALGRVMQSQENFGCLNSLGIGPACRFLNPTPTLESHSRMGSKNFGLTASPPVDPKHKKM